ncbi:MAG: hypothetical protein ACE5HX_02915, partial [bacterium]
MFQCPSVYNFRIKVKLNIFFGNSLFGFNNCCLFTSLFSIQQQDDKGAQGHDQTRYPNKIDE